MMFVNVPGKLAQRRHCERDNSSFGVEGLQPPEHPEHRPAYRTSHIAIRSNAYAGREGWRRAASGTLGVPRSFEKRLEMRVLHNAQSLGTNDKNLLHRRVEDGID
jgi:hypothetical protein